MRELSIKGGGLTQTVGLRGVGFAGCFVGGRFGVRRGRFAKLSPG